MKKKVLLHICCAPCSASAVKMLRDGYDIFFYWYNPNIYSEQEYKNRKESSVKYAEELNVLFYEERDFFYNYGSWKNKSSEKCNLCYILRLEKTAMFAQQNKFDFFSTSLLSSPYQKHDLIKQTADNFAYKYMIKFLYDDFRTCFYESKNSLRQKGYYMQKYCGCNKSLNERLKVKKVCRSDTAQ
ncbi:MAG: epoxyqueuosine reductase QueH [Endomicrobium sp.]|nr:epoxyqueuosine reductase QueH [Endomicrobium sp.]